MSENNKKDFLTITVKCTDLENVVKVVKVANNAIYFSDSDNYLSALNEVCTLLLPVELHNKIGEQYLE